MRALVLVLFACAVSVAQAAPEFLEWHDYAPADHITKINEGRKLGMRPISLSVYGAFSNPRYAAVMVKQMGPQWYHEHNMNAEKMQERFNFYAKLGYKITHITATGSTAPLYAAVFEKTADGVIPITRTDLVRGDVKDQNTIDYWLTYARQGANRNLTDASAMQTELVPSTIATWGSANNPHFAVVLEPNPNRVLWNADLGGASGGSFDTSDEYQKRVTAQTGMGGLRIAEALVTANHQYWGRFIDQTLGDWAARHALTSQALSQQIDSFYKQGFIPISVQGGGPITNPRFSVVFAKTTVPMANIFTPFGWPQKTPGVDAVLKSFMQKNGIKQAAVLAMNDKKLFFSKGYTLAPSGFPIVKGDTYFRVASVGKVLTAMAVEKAIQESKTLTESSKAFTILGWKQKDGTDPADPNYKKITVKHLLQHTAGFPKDWTPSARTVMKYVNKPLPMTPNAIKQYIVEQTLTNATPGSKSQYSNPGYWLLARVVEAETKTTFMTYVMNQLFAPLGVTGLRYRNEFGTTADEARYFDNFSSVSLSNQNEIDWVAKPYGGDSPSVWDGPGGMSVIPVHLMKVIGNLQVKKDNKTLTKDTIDKILKNSYGFDFMGGSPANGVKGGYISGLQSMVYFTDGGLTYAVFWDRNEVYFDAPGWYPSYTDLEAELLKLPQTDDYFSKYNVTPL